MTLPASPRIGGYLTADSSGPGTEPRTRPGADGQFIGPGGQSADDGWQATGTDRPLAEERAEEPKTFQPTYRGLTESLPPGTALLCVTPVPQQRFKLHWHRDGQIDETRPDELLEQGAPDFTMAEIMERKEWRKSYFEVRAWWSLGKRRLNEWLDRLLESSGDVGRPPTLIVWDTTTYQIPWELFYSDAKRAWIGSTLRVVRWLTVNAERRVATFTAAPGACRGGVLALETADIAGHHGSIAQPIAPYNGVLTRTMEDLLTALDATSRQLALVVVRCHGARGETAKDFVLADTSWAECSSFDMLVFQTWPAVVLLNACETGTPAIADRHSFVAVTSFAELFLRRLARGVIATLGRIDLDVSHEFAVRLLCGQGNQRIPDLLRGLRVDAVKRVRRRVDAGRERPDAKDFEVFFQFFSYVYFGHPDAMLELVTQPTGGPDA